MKNMFYFGAAAALAGALVFNACKKEEADIVLPPIGGFNNADEVGKTDLLAHFPLDDAKERISGSIAPDVKNVSYSKGVKGNGAVLAAGYLAFDPIPALTANTASYSLSAWTQIKNNGTNATMLASITRPFDWKGNFNILCETGWRQASSDTLVVKGLFVSLEGNPPADSNQESLNDPSKGGVQVCHGATDTAWTQIIATWDAATSLFQIYANGVKISNPADEFRKTGAVPVGDLVFNPAVSRMVLGAFITNTLNGGTPASWQKPMTGKIDEVRVWKKALSPAEIDALYQLEKAGR
jgi:Concanavalin A-like lectin/glucanases superfamily